MPYPMKKYNYQIVIDGHACAHFSEMSAADRSSEPIEYREGTGPVMTASKMPGLIKYGPITMRRGISNDREFTDWVVKFGAETIERKKIMIQLMNDDNQSVLASWEVDNAWPSKYTAPDLRADADQVAFESIEMAHESFHRIT